MVVSGRTCGMKPAANETCKSILCINPFWDAEVGRGRKEAWRKSKEEVF